MGLTLCSQLSVPTLSPPIAFESPNPIAASAGLCKVLRATVTLNEVSCVGGLIARRYLDGSEVPSFRFLNFTAVSTSKLRRLRNSRLSPRVQTEKCKGRFGWPGYGREDIRRAEAGRRNWEGIRRTAATNENLRARFAPGVHGSGIAIVCFHTVLFSTALAADRIEQSKLLDQGLTQRTRPHPLNFCETDVQRYS
jgi:hypothetical protein